MGEVQKTLNWNLRVSKSPAVVSFDTTTFMRVQTTEIPTPQVQNLPVQLGGHTINSTGKVTKAGQISAQLVEGTDAKVTTDIVKYLKQYWTGDGTDTQGNQAPTNDLKGDYIIDLLDGQNKVTQSFKLVGCLLVPSTAGQLGQEAQELGRMITFEYDDFHITTAGVSW